MYSDIIFSVQEMSKLSDLPTTEQLHGELVATVMSPITSLVGQQLIGSLNAGQKQTVQILSHSSNGVVRALSAHEGQLQSAEEGGSE